MPHYLLDLYVKRAGDGCLRVTVWQDTNVPCINTAMGYGYDVDLSMDREVKRPDLSLIQSRISDLSVLVINDDEQTGTCRWLENIFGYRAVLDSVHTLFISIDETVGMGHGACGVSVRPIRTPALRSITLLGALFCTHNVTTVRHFRYEKKTPDLLSEIWCDVKIFRHVETLDITTTGMTPMTPGQQMMLDQFSRPIYLNLRHLTFRHSRNHSCEAAAILHYFEVPHLETLVISELVAHSDADCHVCKQYQLEEVLMEQVRSLDIPTQTTYKPD